MNSNIRNSDVVYIVDGKKIIEEIEAHWILTFFYTSWIGKILRRIFFSKMMSRVYGCYKNSKLSRRGIKPFIAKHTIKMDDFVVPAGGYKSFNDFFCRELQRNARSIDSRQNSLVSPADAKCWAIQKISKQTTFFVKQQEFTLDRFLLDNYLARYFDGGSLLLLRLAPYDYHRFHAPLDGFFSKERHLKGRLESVNPIAFKHNVMPLIENERHLIMADATNFGCKIAMLPVGAMCVGKIIYTKDRPQMVNKGDEMGYFAFGGSSIVLLVPKGYLNIRKDLIEYTARGFEVAVKMGEPLGFFE